MWRANHSYLRFAHRVCQHDSPPGQPAAVPGRGSERQQVRGRCRAQRRHHPEQPAQDVRPSAPRLRREARSLSLTRAHAWQVYHAARDWLPAA